MPDLETREDTFTDTTSDNVVPTIDRFCHILIGETDQVYCGCNTTAGGASAETCQPYRGEAICPSCGLATCPTCAVMCSLNDRLE